MMIKPRVKLAPGVREMISLQLFCANRVKTLNAATVQAHNLIGQAIQANISGQSCQSILKQAYQMLDDTLCKKCSSR